jgi:hypothetical protein
MPSHRLSSSISRFDRLILCPSGFEHRHEPASYYVCCTGQPSVNNLKAIGSTSPPPTPSPSNSASASPASSASPPTPPGIDDLSAKLVSAESSPSLSIRVEKAPPNTPKFEDGDVHICGALHLVTQGAPCFQFLSAFSVLPS